MATTTTVGGRYELLRVIGRGGMADVWEAEDTTLGRRVALKVLRAGDPALAARLEREARALATLDHPGLVRLLDAGEDAGRPYVVTELVAGPTVAQALRSDPPGPAQVAAVGSQVAAALAYVHRAGIVHRDVKPSNILLDEGGRARLADFGIAQLGDASGMTATGTTVGTVAYMAPEQLEGNRVGPPADVWALGMVLLECLTGARVYEGTPAEVVGRRLAAPVPVPSTLPPGWRQLLTRVLDHDPARRPDASEVASLLAGGPPAAVGAAAGAGDLTSLDPTVADRDAAPTTVAMAAATSVLPPGHGDAGDPSPGRRPQVPARRPRRPNRVALAALAGLAVLAIVIGIAAAGGGGTTPTARSSATSTPRAATTTARPATTTAPTSATTSTTTLSPTAALSQLAGDLTTAAAQGAVPQAVATSVLQSAEQAVRAAAGGGPTAATTPLQQAASTLAASQSSGQIDAATAGGLTADLQQLATALGVPQAATPTTSPAPAPTPAPHGKGGHDGHDG